MASPNFTQIEHVQVPAVYLSETTLFASDQFLHYRSECVDA